MSIFKKISPRRKQFREAIAADKFARISELINSGIPAAVLILAGFIAGCCVLLGIAVGEDKFLFRPWQQVISVCLIAVGTGFAMAVYVYHYNCGIIKNPLKALILCGLFILLLAITRFVSFFPNGVYLAAVCSIACAVILAIAYDQRFAIGMSLFFAVLVCFAAGHETDLGLFLTMAAGILTSCFLLREVRTRMKLLEVGVLAGIAVFVVCLAAGFFENNLSGRLFIFAGKMAAVTIFTGVIIQAVLPLIEKVFGIATSMTLLVYSDANQPLLKKLAMEAPGTFSHSLLIGSIAEAAAETVGANGLLCRVGAYYHDIGKIGKPGYFIENQIGTTSRHEQLSPAMSQLIIVGHVKDGIELAREYSLPEVIVQFIETHHGTTLIEYFYEEARKKADSKSLPATEAGFRYPGPRPQTREAAIVMLADTVEGAVRALTEITPTKIEGVIHSMAMKRLQDGQFDECELTLKELSRIEESLSKSLAAHHHGRIAYPKPAEEPDQQTAENEKENA